MTGDTSQQASTVSSSVDDGARAMLLIVIAGTAVASVFVGCLRWLSSSAELLPSRQLLFLVEAARVRSMLKRGDHAL